MIHVSFIDYIINFQIYSVFVSITIFVCEYLIYLVFRCVNEYILMINMVTRLLLSLYTDNLCKDNDKSKC